MGNKIDFEVKEAIKKLSKLADQLPKRTRKKVLRKAAKPLIKAAKSNIPKSFKPHYRYKTSKATNKIRAPKGKGKIIATYYPGNLRRYILAMSFRRSGDIFVGPRVAKRGRGSGQFKGRRVDGYYANQMEFGNRNHPGVAYMRKSLSATPAVQKIIITETTKIINQFIKKNKI